MDIKYTAEHFPDLITPINQTQGNSKTSAHTIPIKNDFATIPVSAVIITFNEEQNINETLSKLWWCDEIIIVDSGSKDKTVEICEQYGCSVYFRAFNGFGEQKNFGVSKAKNDWILCIDADEVLTD